MMTRDRFQRAILIVSVFACFARAQSTLSTILGGTPDGVPAASATLNEPCAVAADKNGVVYAALKGTYQVIKIDKTGTSYLVAGNGLQGYSGDGGPAKSAELSTPAALAVDSAGNVYIADSTYSVIRRVDTSGIITTYAGIGKGGNSGNGGPASAAALRSPSALWFMANGNLLIADTGNHQIRMIDKSGVISLVAGNGLAGKQGNGSAALSAELNSPAGVASDSAGNIYIADTRNAWIRQVNTSGTISLYAGVDTSVNTSGVTVFTMTVSQPSANNGGFGAALAGMTSTTAATNFILTSPTSLAVDTAGNVYVVEYGRGRVLRVSTTGYIGPYAGTGTLGTVGDGGWAYLAQLNVEGIGIDSQNDLLIADGVTNRVRQVTASTSYINAIGGSGLASFNIKDMYVNGNNVYFSDTAANKVRMLNLTTGAVTLIAGNGNAAFAGDGSIATQASLWAPRGLAMDKSGSLYIADSGNNLIRVVTPDGNINTAVGSGFGGSGGDGLVATAANIYQPAALVFDSTGNMYIAEESGQYIRKVATSGIISTVAGNGTAAAPSAETGVAINQSLSFPQGLAIDSTGALLIADSGNNRIRRLTSDGTITTVAGGAIPGSGGDGGLATSAQLRSPYGISADSAGNFYIADTTNAVIRRVGTNGIIATVAGEMNTPGFTGDGGSPATGYKLNTPYAVAAISPSNILIADTGNQRIRKLIPSSSLTVSSNPAGLLVAVDGQTWESPAVVSVQEGTPHTLSAPSPQSPVPGIRYLAPPAQEYSAADGQAGSAVTMNFETQYALSVANDDGGSVTPALAWQDAGSALTLQATSRSGYDFAGWEGDCQGTGACQIVMNGPRSVKAAFVPSQVTKGVIGAVVGGGMSSPPVTQLSPNGVALIAGSSFAPDGTNASVGSGNLVSGLVPTRLDGVCVMVGSTFAPVLALTPAQIKFQVPQVSTPANLPVQVVTGCGTPKELRSDPAVVSFESASPEFFYYAHNARGKNPVDAVNTGTGDAIGAAGTISGATSAPATPGDAITLYATGLGATSPAAAAGVPPAAESPITGDFWISVGGVKLDPSSVLYAGLSQGRPGVYEIRLQLPGALPGGNQSVQISVNGFVSPVSGFIAVQ